MSTIWADLKAKRDNMEQPVSNCKHYKPTALTVLVCKTCGMAWDRHSQVSKSEFFRLGTPEEIKAVVQTAQVGRAKCVHFVPKHTWRGGQDPVPDCATCNNSAKFYHLPGVLLAGISAFRNAERAQMRSGEERLPCGFFHGTTARPGTCQICDKKWIAHKPGARTLVIEEYTNKHKDWCKCLKSSGSVECDCMSDNEKQEALDRIAVGANAREEKVSCRKFKSRAPGVTKCAHCGEDYYRHTTAACDGYIMFQEWRTHNMNDKELLEWFMSLGKTREARVAICEKLVKDPSYTLTPPPGKITPHTTIVAALLEAITGQSYIKPMQALPPAAANNGQGTAILEAVKVETLDPVCFSCKDVPVKDDGDLCTDCDRMYRREGNMPLGPALRVEVKGD